MLLHTDTFTHKHFYTQTLLTKTLLHTGAFTHRRFDTQALLHTNTFTYKHFYTQALLHTDTLNAEAFTRRRFYTQKLSFTHRRFYTQTLLHTDAFTQRSFYTQTLLHTSQFDLGLLRSNLISCERARKGGDWTFEIAVLPQFLTIEPHFVRKAGDWTFEIAVLPQFLTIEPHFVRKGCTGRPLKSQFYFSFWWSNLISCERVRLDPWNRNFTSVFGDRTSFRAKGLRGTSWNRNFTSVFGDRTSFRAKGLRFVPSRWHCPCSRLQERNRKEGEGKRAKGKRRRCEMRRCEMRRWEDVRRWGEDEKMWRWEGVLQTPTIGRTLRSDALGKNGGFQNGFQRVDPKGLQRSPCFEVGQRPASLWQPESWGAGTRWNIDQLMGHALLTLMKPLGPTPDRQCEKLSDGKVETHQLRISTWPIQPGWQT